jgi:hypothetical protein
VSIINPVLSVDECRQFILFWQEMTGMNHITLTAIVPDGATTTRSFDRGADDDEMASWIQDTQAGGRNIYFTPNETRPGCSSKPSKSDVVAVHCRHADIDPLDEAYPLADERLRLARLAEHLSRDWLSGPTAIIDSGNGIQPLWVTEREPPDDSVFRRAEAENKALEAALGAGSTHNIDRLLRLPGTLNFPNAKKRSKGRGVTRARLIFSNPCTYQRSHCADLANHMATSVAGTDLVRDVVKKTNGGGADDNDPLISSILVELKRHVSRQNITRIDHLPPLVRASLNKALKTRPQLADRWAGMIDDLTEAGKDSSRSGADMSLAAMLKAAGLSKLDTALVLLAFEHGKANNDVWENEDLRLRHCVRCAVRSYEPDNGRAKKEEPGSSGWPEPLDFLADAEMTGAPELKPEHIPEPIAAFVFDTAARLGADPAAVLLAALVSLASVITDNWQIQPKQKDQTWTECPRIWGAIVGDPSIKKSPVLRVTTKPIDKLEVEARERHESATRRHKSEMKAWKDAGSDPATEPKSPLLDRYIVENATTEALSEVLRDDSKATQRAPAGKVLSRNDEMSEFFGNLDRYRAGGNGSADRGAYLRLYDGGRWTVDRVVRGNIAISNWSACFLGGIQPGPIRKIAKESADDGLLQRFCYCVPAGQTRGEDRAPDWAAMKRYDALFPALSALTPSTDSFDRPSRVVLHADAHQHRIDMLDLTDALSHMPDASDRRKSALGKWDALWARMTLIFHMIGIADANARGVQHEFIYVAKGAAVQATGYLRDILLPHLLRAEAVMFSTEQTGHARWIAGFLLSKGADRIAARDIIRAYGALRAPEQRKELIAVMDSLETMGWVRAEIPDDGRPTTNWWVNPAIHSGFAERAKREREQREATKERIRETAARHRARGGAI